MNSVDFLTYYWERWDIMGEIVRVIEERLNIHPDYELELIYEPYSEISNVKVYKNENNWVLSVTLRTERS